MILNDRSSYSHAPDNPSNVFDMALNSCPSLSNNLPKFLLEIDLVVHVEVLVVREARTMLSKEGPFFWCLGLPCSGLSLTLNVLVYPMAVELVVEYTLRLGGKVEGVLCSSFTVMSQPRQWPMDQTSISERIRAKIYLPPFEQLFLTFQHRLHACPMGPTQEGSFNQLQLSHGYNTISGYHIWRWRTHHWMDELFKPHPCLFIKLAFWLSLWSDLVKSDISTADNS